MWYWLCSFSTAHLNVYTHTMHTESTSSHLITEVKRCWAGLCTYHCHIPPTPGWAEVGINGICKRYSINSPPLGTILCYKSPIIPLVWGGEMQEIKSKKIRSSWGLKYGREDCNKFSFGPFKMWVPLYN